MRSSDFIRRVSDYLYGKGLGVNVVLEEDPYSKNEVTLIWFENESGQKGVATSVMAEMCKYADQMKVVINLVINPHERGLIKYYEKFGFVQDGPEEDTGIYMYRHYTEEV